MSFDTLHVLDDQKGIVLENRALSGFCQQNSIW